MRDYLVIGNYGSYNIGDETLLKEIVYRYSDDGGVSYAKFYVPSRNIDFAKIYHKEIEDRIVPVRVGDWFSLLKSFRLCKTVLIGGGGIWSGYTGSLAHLIPIAAIFSRLLGKQLIFESVGIYSTASILDRVLVNIGIKLSNASSVRDQESYNMIWRTNKSKTTIVDDLAFAYLRRLKASNTFLKISQYDSLLSLKEKKKWIVGISLKPLKTEHMNRRIVREFSSAIDTLNTKRDDLHFAIFPFAGTGSVYECDTDLAKQLQGAVREPNRLSIIEHSDPAAWFIAIKDLVDLFIGMRFHSVIFAEQALKPTLIIPYERKLIELISKTNDCSVLMPDEISSKHIVEFIEAVLCNLKGTK